MGDYTFEYNDRGELLRLRNGSFDGSATNPELQLVQKIEDLDLEVENLKKRYELPTSVAENADVKSKGLSESQVVKMFNCLSDDIKIFFDDKPELKGVCPEVCFEQGYKVGYKRALPSWSEINYRKQFQVPQLEKKYLLKMPDGVIKSGSFSSGGVEGKLLCMGSVTMPISMWGVLPAYWMECPE